MDRAQLIAQAKAKYQREQLIAQAKTKYQASQAQTEPEVVQEMPDWLSSGDRAIAKNLAQSDEKQVEFLKAKYPGAEVRLIDGQVQLKQPSEKQWRVLDPDTGVFSKDFLNDAGDLGFDLVADGVQGVSTALGAVGGAAATPYVGFSGAIPGAMAASGASAAGMEALRQKLGQQLGIPQEVDGTDVAITGGVGLASPLLFGAGKPTSSMTAKLAKSLGAKDATIQAAEAGGRGAIERGWDAGKRTVLPKLGELTSGKSADSIRAYADNVDMVDQLERDGVTSYLDNVTNKVQKTLGDTQTRLGKNVQEAIDGADETVDISKAKKSFQDRINFLESKSDLTPAEMAEINSLKGTYQKYFGLATAKYPTGEELAANPMASSHFKTIDSLKDSNLPSVVAASRQAPAGPTYVPEHDSFLKDINGYVNQGITESADQLEAQRNDAIRKAISDIGKIREGMVQTELPNQIDASRAFDLQKKLKQAAAFETNMTPETVSAKGSARGAYSAINDSFDSVSEQIPKAKADYARWKGIENELGTSFDSSQKTYNTLTGLDAKGRTVLKERLKNLADSGELDITDEARVLQAYREFANPSMIPVGLQGSTSTSRTIPLGLAGGALGSYLGSKEGGTEGAYIGGLAGGALGGGLGSPAMVKRLIKANRAVEKAVRKVQPPGGAGMYLGPAATDLVAPWLLMNNE